MMGMSIAGSDLKFKIYNFKATPSIEAEASERRLGSFHVLIEIRAMKNCSWKISVHENENIQCCFQFHLDDFHVFFIIDASGLALGYHQVTLDSQSDAFEAIFRISR